VQDSVGYKNKKARKMFGTNWGQCMLKYKACDYCDDIFGEVADVVFGDAWVEEYARDWKGNNLVICRDKKWSSVFERGVLSEDLFVSTASGEMVSRSQSGSIRHKRHAIGLRVKFLSVFFRIELHKRIGGEQAGAIDVAKCIQRGFLRWLSVRLYPRGRLSFCFSLYKIIMKLNIYFFGIIIRVTQLIVRR